MAIRMVSRKSRGAYRIAKRVFLGELSPTEGAKEIHAQFGMNLNSARDHIYVYKQLRNGSVFHRALSAPDIEYYLAKIEAEDGAYARQVAVHALWLHIKYYEGVRKIRLKTLRSIASRNVEEFFSPTTMGQLDHEFARKVEEARKRTPEERQRRLAAAKRIPSKKPIVMLAFIRNPDVVAEVLRRAAGHCEKCKKPAPFIRRKDGSPYLEVHHVIQLANGGEDSVENAVACCPNCHRCAHFGVELAEEFSNTE